MLFTLRAMTDGDLEKLRPIEDQAFPDNSKSARAFAQLVKSGIGYTLLDDGTVIGYLAIKESEPGTYLIVKMAVATNRQRRGAGRFLLGKAEEIARSKKAASIRLSVREDNARARELYEKAGYATARRSSFRRRKISTILMSKDLE